MLQFILNKNYSNKIIITILILKLIKEVMFMIKKSWTINTGITTGWGNWARGQNNSFRKEATELLEDINTFCTDEKLNEITDLKKLPEFIENFNKSKEDYIKRYNALADKSKDLNLSDMTKLRDELDNALEGVDSLEGKAGEKCNELIKKKFEEMLEGCDEQNIGDIDTILPLIDLALENMKEITTMANSLNFSENVKKDFQPKYDKIYEEFSQKLNEIRSEMEEKRKRLEEKLKASEQMKERIESQLKTLEKYKNFKVDGKNYNELKEALDELKPAITNIQDIFLEDDNDLALYNLEIEEPVSKYSAVITTIEATIKGLDSRKKACTENLQVLLNDYKHLLNSCKETLKESKIRNIRFRIDDTEKKDINYQNKLDEYQQEAKNIGLNNDDDYKAKNEEIVQVLQEIIELKRQLKEKNDKFKSELKTKHAKIVEEFKELKDEKTKTVSSENLECCEVICKNFEKSLKEYIESLKVFYYSEQTPEKVETRTLNDEQLKVDYLESDKFQDEYKFVMTIKKCSEGILSNCKTECLAAKRKIKNEFEKIKKKLNEQIKTYNEKLTALQTGKNVDPSSIPEKVNCEDVISLAKSYYGKSNEKFKTINKELQEKNEQIINLMKDISKEVDKKLRGEGEKILKKLENCIKNKHFKNKEEYQTNHKCLDEAEEYIKKYEETESLELIVNNIKNKINEYRTKCEEFKKQKLEKEKNNQKEIKTEEPKKEQEHKSQEEKPAKIEKNEQKSSEDSEIDMSKGSALADLLSEDDESSNKPENKPNDKPDDKPSNEPDYIKEFLKEFEQILSRLSKAENKIKAKVLSVESGRFIKEYEKINDKTLKEVLKGAEETFEQNEKALRLYFENVKFIEENEKILEGPNRLIEQRNELIKNIDLNSMKELLKAIDYAIEIEFIPKNKLKNWQMGSNELNKAIEDIKKLRKSEIK